GGGQRVAPRGWARACRPPRTVPMRPPASSTVPVKRPRSSRPPRADRPSRSGTRRSPGRSSNNGLVSAAERRARFRELHAGERLFLMPNPWDVRSARLLESLGFEALATTSAGFAWTLGKLDTTVTRDELVAHVRALAEATGLPLNVDSERCYPDDPGGVAETVRLLAEAGAAGCSIEDYDPRPGPI